MQELNRHTGQILARVEAGTSVTIIENGTPIAVIRPYGEEEAPVYAFRTDPMDHDDVPTFTSGDPDFSERTDEYLAGFGNGQPTSSSGSRLK